MLIKVKGMEEPVYVDGFLHSKIENILHRINNNFDAMIIVDGMERSGKSTLASQIAKIIADRLNTEFTLNNVVTSGQDVLEKLETLPKKSVVLIDEGSLVLSSKDAMTRDQKKLEKIFNVIGQKNLIVIIVLPLFFNLNKTIAVTRSLFLLHVYADVKRGSRGRFAYYGTTKKHKLYVLGKKNFNSYKTPSPSFRGRFTNWLPFDYEEYQLVKKKSLEASFKDDVVAGRLTYYEKLALERFCLLVYIIRESGTSFNEMIRRYERLGHKISGQVLHELYIKGQEIYNRNLTTPPEKPLLNISYQDGTKPNKKGEGVPLPNSKNRND